MKCYRRPSGEPTEDMRAHRVSVKLRQKKKLEEMLHDLQQRKQRSMAATRLKRHNLEQSQAKLQTEISKFAQVI